ncbi:hypothetical protein [Nocardia sp. alder85J]|uniref:hypothetical protein n=1 Tax=Nocardia sp. alder85J TaxID=2862949 RepID=UPI001CD7F35F|nr:hypothetical protein [Nocardia sp. alder85J]MCX4091966.1 hypothetical protein [Nocardia sp. alder85J]
MSDKGGDPLWQPDESGASQTSENNLDDPVASSSLLIRKVIHTQWFVADDPINRPLTGNLNYTVTELREKIARVEPSEQPIPVRLRGVFSPAVLLSPGWWERSRVKKETSGEWADYIQRWTYTGFDEWGPSWDFTSNSADESPYFLGQLGEGDEVNSILVVAVKECTQRVRSEANSLLVDRRNLAYPAVVNGLLCHRDYFGRRDPELASILGSGLPKDFSYCLLLNSDRHGITPVENNADYYSGYLWQFLWASRKATEKDTPMLKDCYIIWEHTDLTKSSVIDYNLDGLDHKAKYLADRVGPLEVLQKSARLVGGEPLLSYSEFQQLLIDRDHRPKTS